MNNSLRFVSANQIKECSDLKKLISEIRKSYLEKIPINVPKRSLILKENPFSAFVAMPAYSDYHEIFITKVGAVVPTDISKKSVRALIVVYPTKASEPVFMFDGAEVTNLKCAAVSAMVTEICSAQEAKVLALLGTGVQAQEQMRAVTSVRPITQIRIYSRNQKNVENFIIENQKKNNKIEMIACDSVKMTLDGADIISTATTSINPLFSVKDLPNKRIHINCMGAHTAQSGELSADILSKARLIVEDLELAISEAGDVHKHAMTVSELVFNKENEFKEKLTVFRSTGHASLDLLTVAHIMKRLKTSVENLT